MSKVIVRFVIVLLVACLVALVTYLIVQNSSSDLAMGNAPAGMEQGQAPQPSGDATTQQTGQTPLQSGEQMQGAPQPSGENTGNMPERGQGGPGGHEGSAGGVRKWSNLWVNLGKIAAITAGVIIIQKGCQWIARRRNPQAAG